MSNKIRTGIFGGSGFGGSELIRILLFHQNVEIAFVTANEHAGRRVSEVHKNLNGLTDLVFDAASEDLSSLSEIDVAFFALPHGKALKLIPNLPKSVKVIDLSGDFRIDDPVVFERYYNQTHAGDLQKQFVYGLPETNRDAIKKANYIANPGCFATATLLALAPMVQSGLLAGKIIVDAKTGSSGSGATVASNTHHPQRMNSFYAYKPFIHQHLPEIEQHLRSVGSFNDGFVFMTHSIPVARGIFASCYIETNADITNEDAVNIYKHFFRDSFFVRFTEVSPDINWVKNTNFCDISVNVLGRNVAVFSAIDNLLKGAAGQAVQNMNLMFGLDETTALIFTGSNP